jgi:hypothetical protein
MVSTTLVLAALASLAAAMPSVQRRQDPAYEQCVNVVNYFTTALRLPCRPLVEPPVGSACAYCCYPVEGIPTLDTIPPVNWYVKFALPFFLPLYGCPKLPKHPLCSRTASATLPMPYSRKEITDIVGHMQP